jgi:hypothetical protein
MLYACVLCVLCVVDLFPAILCKNKTQKYHLPSITILNMSDRCCEEFNADVKVTVTVTVTVTDKVPAI